MRAGNISTNTRKDGITMEEIKKEERLHRDCEPHDAEHCDINDHNNLSPADDDCGHTVPGPGPGEGKPKYEGGAPIWQNQDPDHGPGVTE